MGFYSRKTSSSFLEHRHNQYQKAPPGRSNATEATRWSSYVLALECSPPVLRRREGIFEDAVDCGLPAIDPNQTSEVDDGHGRIEARPCWAPRDVEWLDDRDWG